MFPIAFGIIKLKFPQEKISIDQGIFSGVFTAGSAIGLALGGALLSMVPAAIILMLLVRKLIHIKEEEGVGEKEEDKKQRQLQKPSRQQSSVQKSKLGTEYCCVFTKIGNEVEEGYFQARTNQVNNNIAMAEPSIHKYKKYDNDARILKKIGPKIIVPFRCCCVGVDVDG